MFKKVLALLLVFAILLPICPVEGEQQAVRTMAKPLSYDERLEKTDRNTEVDAAVEYIGVENPYGAEKAGEEDVDKSAYLLMEQSEAEGDYEGKSIEAYGEIAYRHMEHLSEDIGARVADSVYAKPAEDDPELMAREYLVREFEGLGYEVDIQHFDFWSRGSYQSANVIASKQGVSDKVVIVGAHYDSVAPKPIWIGASADEKTTVADAVYMYGKGADDNASGVAIMLEAAERIADIETPYTVKFIAFGAEERGLFGSKYYVSQMTEEDIENTVAMINLDSCIAGDNMYVYGDEGEKGWVRELALDIAERLGLDLTTQEGLNEEYPAGTTGLWSDHAPFVGAGIPYGYFEATNWTLGDMDGYTQVDVEYGLDGAIWHTGYDNIGYIEDTFPGRIEERLSTFTQVLTNILVLIKEPGQGVTGVNLSDYSISMTEIEEVEIVADLGYKPDKDNLVWTLGGVAFDEWKKYNSGSYSGDSFITFVEEPVIEGTVIRAKIRFDLPYGTVDLSPRRIRVLYPALIGHYELAIRDSSNDSAVSTLIEYNVYDSYHVYDEIKPAIDEIIEKADPDRYVEYKSLGTTYDGRDVHFAILAEDEESVEQYLDELMPLMTENPQMLQDKLESGTMGEYKVPIWFNNIHPDEAPGIDAIIELFEQLTTQEEITYKTTGSIKDPKTQYSDGTNIEDPDQEAEITIKVDEALDNVILLFNFTVNPDGRYYNTRGNVNGFDINRDNVYQTQVEARLTTEEIAKWKPMSFLDFHGFMPGFCIEPCTTPHDPNFEYDLLIENMLEQAHLMGKAGVANTKYTRYEIPFEDYNGGWDDGVPSYTAVYAMSLGALGHTIEIPELNEASVDALVNTGFASISYVVENKDRLYNNQLEFYERGIEGIDAREEVDPWLLNAAGEVIGRPRGANENFFPEYYVIPVDKRVQKNGLEAYKLAQYMIRNGVKVEKSTEAVTVEGITFPAGSFVIDMHQALRGYANEVLYDGYDVSDFAMMYAEIVNVFHDTRGFDRYEVRDEGVFDGKTEKIEEVHVPGTVVPGKAENYVISNNNNDVVKAVNKLLKKGRKVRMLTETGKGYVKGDYIVSRDDLILVADDHCLDVAEYTGKNAEVTLTKPTVAAPSASGHMLFALKELGFDIVDNPEEGSIIVTDSYADVVSEIEAGKAYVGVGPDSMYFAKEILGLESFDYIDSYYEALMRGNIAQDSLITAGYPEESAIYNPWGGYISSLPEGAKVLTQIKADDTYFKAGWWPDTDIYYGVDYGKLQSKGKALAITTDYGEAKSKVTLFANYLVNKAHPQGDWRMLANSIFTSSTNTIDPAIASFDKKHSERKDIKVTVSGSRLIAVKNGGYELIRGKDYEIDSNVMTIKASYLSTLSTGKKSLTLIFEKGNSCVLNLSITDSTPSESGGGSSGGRRRANSSKLEETSETQTAVVIFVPTPTLDKTTGIAYAEISAETMDNAIISAEQEKDGRKQITIALAAAEGAKSYKTVLPAKYLAGDPEVPAMLLNIETALGTVTVQNNMLPKGFAGASDSVAITLGAADTSGLSDELIDKLAGRPVFDIGVEINGVRRQWSNPEVPVTVTLNYKPTADELKNPDNVVIWYIDDITGEPVPVPNCRYDTETETVTFTTTHLRKFAIVYSMPGFIDIGSFSWANKEINAITARGILKVQTDTEFEPQGFITRAEFIYGLVRSLGLKAKLDGNFSDISNEDYYYNEIGIAKALGVTQGMGNNRFGPDNPITRQDMMVLTAKALKKAGKLDSSSSVDLSRFEDSMEVSDYARESITQIVADGIIIGSGNRINPRGATTRAEASVILYRINQR